SHPRHHYSCPTRRSSDLDAVRTLSVTLQRRSMWRTLWSVNAGTERDTVSARAATRSRIDTKSSISAGSLASLAARPVLAMLDGRSEEHTSELQSPDHLVC